MRFFAILCLLACIGLCAGADPVLATIACGGGASKNAPVSVTTNATESAVVFTTSSGDNPQIQYMDTVAWTWLGVSGSATIAVAANQTLTVQEDGGALVTTRYVKSTTSGIMTINRVR